MGIPKEEIRMNASFVKDFEFEEFQFGYLVFYLESYFRINIRENEYSELDTIGSVVNFVKRKLTVRDRLKISRRKICPLETLKSIPMIVHQPTNKSLAYTHLFYRPLFQVKANSEVYTAC